MRYSRVCVVVALVALAAVASALREGAATQSALQQKDGEEDVVPPPVLSETEAHLLTSSLSQLMNGEAPAPMPHAAATSVSLSDLSLDMEDHHEPDAKQTAQIAQKAAEAQRQYDAYYYTNAIRYMQQQLKRKSKHGVKKASDKARARVKRAHKHMFPSTPVWNPAAQYMQYFAHPQFQQQQDDDDDDEDDDEDSKQKEAADKSKAQVKPPQLLETQATVSTSEPLSYSDSFNNARFEETQRNQGKATSAYGAPMDMANNVAAPVAPINQQLLFGAQNPLMGRPVPAAGPSVPPGAPMYNAPRFQQMMPQQQQMMPMQQQMPQMQMQMQPQQQPQMMRFAEPGLAQGNPNPTGVPMAYFPPTAAPPPAPSQVPSPSAMVNAVYPFAMSMESTAQMPMAAQGVTQQPGVNTAAEPMAPAAPNARFSQYPFNSFVELEAHIERRPVAEPEHVTIHAVVDALARHPDPAFRQGKIHAEHTTPFPLL